MEEDFSIDFKELNKLPNFEIDEDVSIMSEYQKKPPSIVFEYEEDPNLDKIYEYLNNDIEEQQKLIDLLKEFEIKLDEFISNS
ncbi:hypothetical protein NBO_560g0003 [Nosema bombycis CQ1]|uniref:Uncharacterized protein n=1 Tax=Nosema bombycis (strain CQ1 / CVCC 102059) TaxID=578461 RepID=R0MDC0_NOSB1|nr:hypothetical protein NBO_560g0003 [Nosema bombycis CQ1]|eukprot:EOB12070.1 hypothetical protein NBO_560g0003 [Nosema bombycis CQ1]